MSATAAAAAATGGAWSAHSSSQHVQSAQPPAPPPSCPLQGLELLDGQLRSGLPFDLGSTGANAGFSSMTQATHDRLGSGQVMPAELFAAGGWAFGCGMQTGSTLESTVVACR